MRWQAPKPSFPAGRDALLGAMSDWMAAEKRAREASLATELERSRACAYITRLEGWTRPQHSVPNLTKAVKKELEPVVTAVQKKRLKKIMFLLA